MTIRVRIENLDNSAHALLINKGAKVHVALRPGEASEETVWEGQPITIEELTDATRKDVIWLPGRGT